MDKVLEGTDWLILKFSWPDTHCEFQFSAKYSNVSFSSTLRDGAKGCRFKQIDYTANPERWNTLIVPLTDEQEVAAFAKANEINGCEYDLIGLLHLETGLAKTDPDKYWCSEAVAELLKAAGKFLVDSPDQYTPAALFDEIFYWLSTNQSLENPE
jgi:hypothetical protein